MACGFNAAAFSQYGQGLSADPVVAPPKPGSSAGPPPPTVNKTKPAVAKDDSEYEMDNCDYFDDLNIDMVHGRAVGDAAGTLGGSSGEKF